MPVPLEQFVKHLEDSGILAGDTLGDFLPPKASPRDAEDLARELVRHKKLTKFQAEELYRGKGKSLTLGNYVLLEKIGAGGMGQVFKAEHRRMHRMVAIKLLPAAMTRDKAAIARFEREVTAAARLRHPNIIAADDADQANGVHFLVMELVDGSDLSALVKKNGPFPVDKAVNYILQAARGLEFAHSEGIVHRDIKPANLLLDKKGTVKILDMGLARIHGEGGQAELTSTGAVMGTIDYMAPEQALNTKTADARADIYALGCSLYYLLTGKATYDGDTLMAKLLAHRELPIPDLRAVCPQASDQLEGIFQMMVAKQTEDRYQTMTAVIADLEGCGGGQAVNPPSFAASDTGLTNFLKEVEIAQNSVVQKKAPDRTLRRSWPNLNWQSIAKDKRKLMMMGGGVLGALVLLVAVVVSVRTKDGTLVENGGKKSIAVKQATVAKKGWQDWPADAPLPAIAPFDAKQAKKHQAAWAKYLKLEVEYTNSIGMKFILIPPGEFTMGSTPAEIEEALKFLGEDKHWQDCVKSEAPQHKVILTQPIYLGVHEVTQADYEKVMGKNPSWFAATGQGKEQVAGMDTATFPVEMVSWNDAAEFCAKLSQQEQLEPVYFRSGETVKPLDGTGYRLPTEAEWEFGCRAGTTTKYWTGDGDEDLPQAGWFGTNSGGGTHAVGELKANPFGLFDIHGNNWEWVQDWWEPTYYGQFQEKPALDPSTPFSAGSQRVIRGGLWVYFASFCRSSSRHANDPSGRLNHIGFRVALAVGAVKNGEPIKPATALNDPAFQNWMKSVAYMPAKKQVEAVSKKLQELNPEFDGKITAPFVESSLPVIQDGNVVEVMIFPDKVADLSPFRAFSELRVLQCWSREDTAQPLDVSGLKGMNIRALSCFGRHLDFSVVKGLGLSDLGCIGGGNTDLTQLSGMPLKSLTLSGNWGLTSLEPLKGTPLNHLACNNSQVADLSPLSGMPLTTLVCYVTKVADLSPLTGMPLELLYCDQTLITDLSPLAGMKLKKLSFTPNPALKGVEAIRQMDSLVEIGTAQDKLISRDEFWKKYDAGAFTSP